MLHGQPPPVERREESDEDEDDAKFYDANNEPENVEFRSFEMDLDTSLGEAKLAICYFFNNKFDEARTLMIPFAETSLYHSMGHVVFSFLEAVLTFEHQHIDKAATELKQCLALCQRYRKKSTITEAIGKKFKRRNYSHLTDMEAHAELCMAEALLLKAVLTLIEDETLSSLIRGSITIRNCYGSYKECALILQQRNWHSKTSKIHFESGVRMGMGTFNLMISLLPARIIKVLEFIGFSGNKENGLADLYCGYQLDGLRQILCALTLLGYHLIVCYVLGHREGDLALCEEILSKQLTYFPKGVWFLFFKGRLEFMRGDLNEAELWYTKSWKSQDVWTQFHHISFWELLWVNCLKLNWREASLYATFLVEKSKWSRTIYSYQKGAIMLMLKDPTELERHTIKSLMLDAPTYKQRIAGKSLPMEKFILKKTARYFAQNETLCLPAIELMYIWNTFKVFSKNYQVADGVLQLIEQQVRYFNSVSEDTEALPYFYDNRALCLLLRGATYRYMGKYGLATQDLSDCIAMQANVKEDLYIVAYAHVEIGLVHADEKRYDQAIAVLEEAKKKYTGYSLESRLHFRIHAALLDLKKQINA